MPESYELTPEDASAVVCAALELLASVEDMDSALLSDGVIVSASVMRHLVDQALVIR